MQDFSDYNYSALFRKFSRNEIQAFNKSSGWQKNSILIGLFLLGGGVVGMVVVVSIASSHGAGAQLAGVYLSSLTMFALPIAIYRSIINRSSAELRFSKFAEENDLLYVQNASETYATSTLLAYNGDGAVFDVGSERKFQHIIGNSSFTIGGYQYTTGSGKSRSVHYWQIATIKISKKLPHILFDAKRNNFIGFSNLPKVFKKNQLVTSEAEFDDTFNLYAPEGFTIDALSFIAPDFMYVMNSHFADYDVEIIDDYIVLYKSGQLQPRAVPSLIQHLKLVADELEDNISSYNASLKPLEAADRQARGRRLSEYHVGPVLGGLVFVAYVLYQFLDSDTGELSVFVPVIVIAVIIFQLVKKLYTRQ